MKTILKAILMLTIATFFPKNAKCEGVSLINDLEIQDMILSITKPIFKVANLQYDEINVYIISDPAINAFAYYNNIFVNTGLIVFAKDSSTLFGVIAHETGHVARKHITRMVVRSSEDLEKYGRTSLLLAALLVVITPAAATAALQSAILTPAIGLAALMQNRLRYSRENEIEADESAISYLSRLDRPISGLYDTMMFFHQSLPTNAIVYKYMMTHPLPEERLDRIQIAVTQSKGRHFITTCEIEIKLRRSQAKIFGYLDRGEYEVKYPINRPGACFTKEDLDFFIKYEELHQKWKDKKYKHALKIANQLLNKRSEDTFLKETKALLLIQLGEVEEGISLYREVIKKINTNSARFNLAYHLSSSSNKSNIEESIQIMKKIVEEEKNPTYYTQLAFAYSNLGDEISYFVYSAEANFYAQNYPLSFQMAQRALSGLKKHPEHAEQEFLKNKAEDITDAILSKMTKSQRKKLTGQKKS